MPSEQPLPPTLSSHSDTTSRQGVYTLLSLAIALLSSAGCTEIVYVDPPFSYEVSQVGCGGELGVHLGLYKEQIYNDFAEVAELPIVDGLQGGTWCMPAVRTFGLKNPVRLKASITTAAGEVVGTTVLKDLRLILSPDGACEVLALPIPIAHPNDPNKSIHDLYGAKAKLEVELRDGEGTVGKHSADITLIQG